jgi:hypothetical protein
MMTLGNEVVDKSGSCGLRGLGENGMREESQRL